MSNWIPAGSVPHDTAYADGEYNVESEDGSVPYFSTQPYRPVGEKSLRNPKSCIGNSNMCKGWKSAGTDYCAGHGKSLAKEAEAATLADKLVDASIVVGGLIALSGAA